MNDDWINVKDVLPTKNSWVFVCYETIANDADGKGLDIAYFDGVVWAIGNKHKPYSLKGKVTHWMELPKLP